MVAEPVRLAYLWRPLLTDTDDNMVIETAINGRADVLVTLNLRDFGAAKGMFDVVKSNFALRLQPSLMEEARKVAKAEGVAMNQLINVAVAEKVSALRTEEYFAERAAKGPSERRSESQP